MKKSVVIFVVLVIVTAIDQPCPCPTNSNCLANNNMCACNTGFIGNCSTPAQVISSNPQSIFVGQNVQTLLQTSPMEIGHYL